MSSLTSSLWIGAVLGVFTAGTPVGLALEGTHAKLRPVSFNRVQIQDAFWLPRIETNRTATLPHTLDWCEKTGRISNFAKAGGLMKGEHEGIYFNDSDVYKVLEGAAYTLALRPDKQLEARIDAIIDKIAAAQQPDGYLNTYYTLKEPDKRWTNLGRMHELYCAGHLIEAAVAYHRATGKRKLLDVACRLADHIDSVFGPGKRVGYPGHEEIELALVKLYRETGEDRYRKLAEFFIEVRGQNRNADEQYCQAHLPIKEQSEIVGHAVRAMYLYSGVADIAALTGDRGYIDAMERLWRNVTGCKMYVTGGIGAERHTEGFSADYDLPNGSAYAETCASIGMALWNHRLLMLHAQGRFADVLERVMYNGVLSGVSLDGRRFFYDNPLASYGQHARSEWFNCACCPTNVVRFLPSVGGYIYAEGDDGPWVNLYVASTAEVSVRGQQVKLVQKTDYPWSGKVTLEVEPAAASEFALHLRIPGWAESFNLLVNGQPISDAKPVEGYVTVSRSWKAGDVVELDLPMEVRRVYAHPRVEADAGRVALQRGPLVYCVEGVDNGGAVHNLVLPPGARLTSRKTADLLGGVVVVEGEALAVQPIEWGQKLYRSDLPVESRRFQAVPYYAWNNRGRGPMVVWLAESIGLAEIPLRPSKASGAKVTVSYAGRGSSLTAVNDNVRPVSSADRHAPVLSWAPHKGTTEWITYTFDRPMMISSAEVYWLVDDQAGSPHRLPVSWWISWKRAGQWEPVAPTGNYTVTKDAFDRVTFEPVPTLEVRLEVELPKDASSGVLEWRVD